MLVEASYVCGSCGEEIVVTVDPQEGDGETYVEDCPVCCRPHVLRVCKGRDGDVWIESSPE